MAVKHRLQSLEKKHGTSPSLAQVKKQLERLNDDELDDYYTTLPSGILYDLITDSTGIPREELTSDKLRELIAETECRLS